MPLGVANEGKSGSGKKFLLTGYQVVQKSGLTVKRHVAATLVERWLVNPEEAGEASLAQKEGKTTMAAKRKAKAKGKAKKKAKKKGKK